MVAVIIVIAILVVLVLTYVVIYNGLVSLKNRTDEAYSDIETQLKRRHDLIPNLVNTVKGYATHEREVFENVTAARAGAVNANGPQAQGLAENVLTNALGKLFAVAEAYPDLKANQNFLSLQNELTDTEDKVQAARRFYNMQVRNLNTRIQSIPSKWVAGAAGATEHEFFEIDNPAEREAPQVSF